MTIHADVREAHWAASRQRAVIQRDLMLQQYWRELERVSGSPAHLMSNAELFAARRKLNPKWYEEWLERTHKEKVESQVAALKAHTAVVEAPPIPAYPDDEIPF